MHSVTGHGADAARRPETSAARSIGTGPRGEALPRWSRGAVGRDPQHVRDAVVELLPPTAVEVHVPPGVIETRDGEASDVTREQLEHEHTPLRRKGEFRVKGHERSVGNTEP